MAAALCSLPYGFLGDYSDLHQMSCLVGLKPGWYSRVSIYDLGAILSWASGNNCVKPQLSFCLPQGLVFGLCACICFFLAGCSEDADKTEAEVVRHIKHMTLKAKPVQQTRVIAGIVSPIVQSNVAFEIGGQVHQMHVSVGDRVKKGDLIAELDPQTYELNVRSAEGSLLSAEAALVDAEKKFEQQSKLYKKKYTTKTNYDTALATLEKARSNVEIQKSALAIAKRNLSKTKLRAPFDGAISEKSVEVFEEVTAGKTIVVLHTENNYQFDLSLPESLFNEVHVVYEVVVKLSFGSNEQPLKGIVKEVSSQAGQANAFPVTINLTETVSVLRPGMSVEVTFAFSQKFTGESFNVPIAAVTPSGEQGVSYAFVYQPEKKVVERRSVKIVNIRDNVLIIAGDVKEGEIIAVAGLSFLHDQMPVRLLEAN